MTRSLRLTTAVLVALCATPVITMLGKGRVTLTPVSATFRCPGADCLTLDGISGDGAGAYVGVTDDQEGAYLDGGSDLYLSLKPTYSRFVQIDFDAPINGPAPCAAAHSCRRNFTTYSTNNSQPPSITNPLDASGRELPNGFLDIPIGATVAARYKMDFFNASQTVRFTVRFNADAYPGSSNVTVTRTGTAVWVVEAHASDVAELVSVPVSGKQTVVNEGFYSMPFRITVTR